MTPHFQNLIGIVDDLEIKTPAIVHARLPDVLGLVVFLRMQRGVMEICRQKPDLPVKCLSDGGRSVVQSLSDRVGIADFHREDLVFRATRGFLSCRFKSATMASAVSKGP